MTLDRVNTTQHSHITRWSRQTVSARDSTEPPTSTPVAPPDTKTDPPVTNTGLSKLTTSATIRYAETMFHSLLFYRSLSKILSPPPTITITITIWINTAHSGNVFSFSHGSFLQNRLNGYNRNGLTATCQVCERTNDDMSSNRLYNGKGSMTRLMKTNGLTVDRKNLKLNPNNG